MNEAETRAEYIDPALKDCRLGRGRGQPHPRASIPSRSAASKATGGAAKRSPPITCLSIATTTGRGRGKGLGRIPHRRRCPGQELRRQAGRPLCLFHQRAGHLRHRYAVRPGGRTVPRYPGPEELWNLTFAEANAWRDRFAAVPFEDKGGYFQPRYLSGHRHRACPGCHRRRENPHPAHAGHRHRQDLHRLSDRVEAVSQPLEPEPRAVAPPTYPVSGRPQYSRRSGVQRLLRLPRRRHGADRAGGHPQERQGSQERQPVLHHLPDLHERPAQGRQALALFRRVPAGLLRLHRH